MFGFLDRNKRRAKRARKHELRGELVEAVETYLEAGEPEEAARVLLLRADAEGDPKQRMVICAQAARVAPDTAIAKRARQRKAKIRFDLVRHAPGAALQSELLAAADELGEAGAWELAAEAYALLGDTHGEIGALREAGAIGKLEQRLREDSVEARRKRDLAALLGRIRDLDRIGGRRDAIRAARAWLELEHDDQVAFELERMRGRLLTGPDIRLEIEGTPTRFVLGSTVTIGRSGADVLVHASQVSRQHLRLFRVDGLPHIEDLDTRNGTMLAGARVSGSLPVAAGLELSLAGEIPCKIEQCGDGLSVDVAGETRLIPLGPVRLGAWSIVDAHDGDERYVVLRTAQGESPPHLGGYRVPAQIELCHGDRFSARRDGPATLAVP